MFKNKIIQFSTGIAFSVISIAALAQPAPVEDISQGGYSDSASVPPGAPGMPSQGNASALSLAERVGRLEQQISNLTEMNLPQQVADLQQQVQKLQGQLDELSHQASLMTQQQQRVEALPAVPPPSQTPPNQAILTAAKPPPSDETPRVAPPQTDAAAYQQAFSLLADKKYDQSITAFKEYLRRHPDGQFAANAHYWLGDLYFQQKNLKQAELELNLVITQYSTSGKAPDAQLKLATIHAQQGNTEQARQEFKTIIDRFPGTPAAQIAGVQLQQLNLNNAPQ